MTKIVPTTGMRVEAKSAPNFTRKSAKLTPECFAESLNAVDIDPREDRFLSIKTRPYGQRNMGGKIKMNKHQ